MTLSQMEQNPQSLPARASPPNRRWILYFALLAVLGACAVTIPWIYNASQQLRPEQLAAARTFWEENGPKDYDLEYVSREEDKLDAVAGPEIETVSVQVRAGRVESATRNGRQIPPAQAQQYCIEGIFDRIQSNLEGDAQEGRPQTYAHARFDNRDGHPIHYVRRVMGSRQRLELIIQTYLPGEEPKRKPSFPNS